MTKCDRAVGYDCERDMAQRFAAVRGWVLAMFVILHPWAIDLATAQSPATQTYRIAAGDKIGVTVFGQPDLSG